MSYAVKKVSELIDYLNRYQQAIDDEKCSPISRIISELLQAISQAQHVEEDSRFGKAAVAYQADRTIQYMNVLEIPALASTTNRVFNNVIKKELIGILGSEFKPPKELLVDQSQDLQTQAVQYEALASISSYDQNFMQNALLASLHCYMQANQGIESSNSMRIESFLEALNTPTKLIYAKRYLFAALRNSQIPFSITHPRFIEVFQDFCKTVNESPNDETVAASYTKWVKALR